MRRRTSWALAVLLVVWLAVAGATAVFAQGQTIEGEGYIGWPPVFSSTSRETPSSTSLITSSPSFPPDVEDQSSATSRPEASAAPEPQAPSEAASSGGGGAVSASSSRAVSSTSQPFSSTTSGPESLAGEAPGPGAPGNQPLLKLALTQAEIAAYQRYSGLAGAGTPGGAFAALPVWGLFDLMVSIFALTCAAALLIVSIARRRMGVLRVLTCIFGMAPLFAFLLLEELGRVALFSTHSLFFAQLGAICAALFTSALAFGRGGRGEERTG